MEHADEAAEPPGASLEALLYRAPMAPRPSAPTTGRPGSVIFSCVVDGHPQIEYAAWVWAATLTAYGGQSPSSLAVHFVDDCASELRGHFAERGINTASVDRYDVAHPPSNKLAQLTSPLLTGADHYVLCDCDLAFCGDFSPWVDGDQVRAKLVDCAVFSLDDWMRILTASGLCADPTSSDFPVPTATTLDDKQTLTSYCNGGLLVLPSHTFDALKEAWPRWHRWLQGRRELLGEHHYHADQVSFALACIAEELDVDLLPDRLNLPTHLLDHLGRLEGVDPVVLHFHHRSDPHGLLRPTGVASVDERIAQVNALIDERLHQSFDNALFWNYRYAGHPELGSGLGSRGEIAEDKRRMLLSALSRSEPRSTLDVGCGDLELWDGLEPPDYTGIDISPVAIELARKRRPDLRFLSGDIRALNLEPHDLVLALDVLIHQPTQEEYERLLRELVALTRDQLIVSGYQQQPRLQSAITFFFEPLGQSLGRIAGGGSMTTIGQYRDIDVVAWAPNG